MSGVERGQGVGIPVWHERYTAGSIVCDCFYDAPPEEPSTPGRWFPTDADSLAQVRERILRAIDSNVYATVEYRNGDDIAVIDDEEIADAADAVMRLLFGQDGEGA